MAPQPRIPTPEGLNAEFYARAQDGVLHLQQCSDCGLVRHPPRYHCPRCASARFGWRPSAGQGRLFSWTVTHMPFDRGWAEEIPYVTGVLELDDGIRLVGSVEGVAVDELRIGLPLAVEVTPLEPEFSFLAFHPLGSDGP